MHELSITQSILDIALRHGETANAKKITDLYIVIGQLSSVVDDSVQFYWDIISKGTIAEGATLHFERIRACFHCKDCENAFEPDGYQFECPQCGSDQVNLVAGREFQLESIEVE